MELEVEDGTSADDAINPAPWRLRTRGRDRLGPMRGPRRRVVALLRERREHAGVADACRSNHQQDRPPIEQQHAVAELAYAREYLTTHADIVVIAATMPSRVLKKCGFSTRFPLLLMVMHSSR